MANNPYVNKVQTADGTTIIDISDTTAVASDVASGKYFYDASGAKVQGTGSGGGGGANLRPPVTVTPRNYTQVITGDTESVLVFSSSASTVSSTDITFSGVTWEVTPVQNSTYNIVVDFRRVTKGRNYTFNGTVTWNGYGTTVTLNEVGSSRTVSMAINKTTLVVTVGNTEDDNVQSIDIAITGDLSYDGLEQVTVAPIPAQGGSEVTGTFKGTTTGTAMDISVPYTGNGYPVALLIAPTEGPANSNTGTFYNTLKRYACAMFFAMKDRTDAVPSYNGAAADAYTGINRYKSSSSSATTQTNSNINNSQSVCYDTDATGSAANIVRIRAKNKISVYIAGTSYGFMANIEYTYHIIYSE